MDNLQEILTLHKKWLNNEPDGVKADLRDAGLYEADLREADLRGADLRGAKASAITAFFALQCPETGAYIAYKKASGLIVELEIAKDAKRSSATSRKCRASKAKVLSITTLDGKNAEVSSVKSDYDSSFVYTVGETVEVQNFDENRWNECSSGIHHFITRQEAVDYI